MRGKIRTELEERRGEDRNCLYNDTYIKVYVSLKKKGEREME